MLTDFLLARGHEASRCELTLSKRGCEVGNSDSEPVFGGRASIYSCSDRPGRVSVQVFAGPSNARWRKNQRRMIGVTSIILTAQKSLAH